MLTGKAIVAFVPTKDAARARGFYEGVLALKFRSDDGFALVFEAGPAAAPTIIRVATVPGEHKPWPFTMLGWEVEDVKATAAGLRERGVTFERFPGMEQDEGGVWAAPGGAQVAWFKDP